MSCIDATNPDPHNQILYSYIGYIMIIKHISIFTIEPLKSLNQSWCQTDQTYSNIHWLHIWVHGVSVRSIFTSLGAITWTLSQRSFILTCWGKNVADSVDPVYCELGPWGFFHPEERILAHNHEWYQWIWMAFNVTSPDSSKCRIPDSQTWHLHLDADEFSPQAKLNLVKLKKTMTLQPFWLEPALFAGLD